MTRDPICTHRSAPAGRVSHPTNTGLASTYVCHRERCQADAAEWVRELTGVAGQFFELGNR